MNLRSLLLWASGLFPYLGFALGLPPYYKAMIAVGTPGEEEIVSRGFAFFPVAIALGIGAGFAFFCLWLVLKVYERIQRKKA